MKKTLILTIICIGMLIPPVAMADLINPTLGSTDNSAPGIVAFLEGLDLNVNGIVMIDATDDGTPGPLLSNPEDPTGGPTAEISWDLAGTGYQALYVVVKDGSSVGPAGGPAIHWLYYTVTLDQALSSDGWQQVSTQIFNPSAGDISHIALYGNTSSVPEPTALILLGLGLVGIAGVRRFKK